MADRGNLQNLQHLLFPTHLKGKAPPGSRLPWGKETGVSRTFDGKSGSGDRRQKDQTPLFWKSFLGHPGCPVNSTHSLGKFHHKPVSAGVEGRARAPPSRNLFCKPRDISCGLVCSAVVTKYQMSNSTRDSSALQLGRLGPVNKAKELKDDSLQDTHSSVAPYSLLS